jgi:hypothetical protein
MGVGSEVPMKVVFEPPYREYMIREHLIGPILINVVINGVIVAALFRGQDVVAIEGAAVFDFLPIAFMVAFMSCLIVTSVVARQVAQDDVHPLPAASLPTDGIALRARWQRGLALGVAALAALGLPAAGLLSWVGPESLSYWTVVATKAAFGGLVGAATGPIVGWWALVAASRSENS